MIPTLTSMQMAQPQPQFKSMAMAPSYQPQAQFQSMAQAQPFSYAQQMGLCHKPMAQPQPQFMSMAQAQPPSYVPAQPQFMSTAQAQPASYVPAQPQFMSMAQAQPQVQYVQQAPAPSYQPAQVIQQQAAPQEAQSTVKLEIGDWLVCEDAQGEFYYHSPTEQSFDQAPPQLVELIRASQNQPAAAQGSDVLADLGGGWLQCQDEQGIFYFNEATQQSSDVLPAELGGAPQMAQAQPQVQYAQAQMAQAQPQVQYLQPQMAQAQPQVQYAQAYGQQLAGNVQYVQ